MGFQGLAMGFGGGTIDQKIDAARPIIRKIIADKLKACKLSEELSHKCEGLSVEKMREEWISQGRPEEDLFILSYK